METQLNRMDVLPDVHGSEGHGTVRRCGEPLQLKIYISYCQIRMATKIFFQMSAWHALDNASRKMHKKLQLLNFLIFFTEVLILL